MKSKFEEDILSAWNQNAKAWVSAIRNEEIESRITTTNRAVVNIIVKKQPEKVLDLGCGEGWLSRSLTNQGIDVLGIDAIPELIATAVFEGGARFQVMTYQEISSGSLKDKFDLIVCNFSLIGKESVDGLFENFHELLNEDGFVVVQTLHPHTDYDGNDSKDGWRSGSWSGFSDKFKDAPPWYFRTMDTWKKLFTGNRLILSEIIETKKPITGEKLSIVFVGKVNR